MEVFEKKLQEGIAWADYFMLGGHLYKIYEYGGGDIMKMDYEYVYFLNKRTGNLIYIKYLLNPYRFISVELQENAYLWR